MHVPDRDTLMLLAEIDRDEARRGKTEKILCAIIAAIAIAAVSFASL